MSRFRASGLTWSPSLEDNELEAALYPKVDLKQERAAPVWSDVHREMKRKDVHVTRALLWEEYKRKEPKGYGYSWFCHHLESRRR